MLQTVDLPIDKLAIQDLYIPENIEKHHYLEEELLEKIQTNIKNVEIRNISNITSASQIEFYN